jgi:putative lipoic acid-binding regulatory protein
VTSEYDKAAAELAKLSRAERYDSLLEFPADFSFKAIGEGAEFSDAVRRLLDEGGHRDAIVVERPSKKGRFVSITFSLCVQSGAEIDAMYTRLETLDDLKMVL